jgi:4-nitrophenyl phosphatase
MENERLSKLKTILLDMDGVLWKDADPILDIHELFKRIRAKNYSVYCVTNNSTRTVIYNRQKLNNFGVDIEDNQIITSAEATAVLLKERYPNGGPVYAVGEEGLHEALQNYGFYATEDNQSERILAVVAGLDRNLTYQKIEKAANFVSQGILFLGTNPDTTFPMPDGFAPGAGVIIKAIETASGKQAGIIGKPEKHLYNLALRRAGSSPEETMMIGDRLETDIAGAQNLGIRTGLVLSGVTDKSAAVAWNPAPDMTAENALLILDRLKADEK